MPKSSVFTGKEMSVFWELRGAGIPLHQLLLAGMFLWEWQAINRKPKMH